MHCHRIWSVFLSPYLVTVFEDEGFDALRRAESIGRPVGGEEFLIAAKKQLGRRLRPAKRGPKPRDTSESSDFFDHQ